MMDDYRVDRQKYDQSGVHYFHHVITTTGAGGRRRELTAAEMEALVDGHRIAHAEGVAAAVDDEWRERLTRFEALTAERDALAAENQRLRERLDECQLRYIEATNPGIDMDEVKAIRNKAAALARPDGDAATQSDSGGVTA